MTQEPRDPEPRIYMRQRTSGSPPSILRSGWDPAGALAAKPEITSHHHSINEECALQEAAQELQRCMAESLDNLLAVHQRAMAACNANVFHGQQQPEEEAGRQCLDGSEGTEYRARRNIRWDPQLETSPFSEEAIRAISIPGICDADEETSSTSPSSLSHARIVPTTPTTPTLRGSPTVRKQLTGSLWNVSICRASTGTLDGDSGPTFGTCKTDPCGDSSSEVGTLRSALRQPRMVSPHEWQRTRQPTVRPSSAS